MTESSPCRVCLQMQFKPVIFKLNVPDSDEEQNDSQQGSGHEGLNKKEKGLRDLDNSLVTAARGVYKGTKWGWEKYNKD